MERAFSTLRKGSKWMRKEVAEGKLGQFRDHSFVHVFVFFIALSRNRGIASVHVAIILYHSKPILYYSILCYAMLCCALLYYTSYDVMLSFYILLCYTNYTMRCYCIYRYICTNTIVHIYIHMYTHTHMHIHTYTCINTYIHTYIHAYMHACLHTYIHTYIHT